MLQRQKDQKIRVCGKCSVSLDKMLVKDNIEIKTVLQRQILAIYGKTNCKGRFL